MLSCQRYYNSIQKFANHKNDLASDILDNIPKKCATIFLTVMNNNKELCSRGYNLAYMLVLLEIYLFHHRDEATLVKSLLYLTKYCNNICNNIIHNEQDITSSIIDITEEKVCLDTQIINVQTDWHDNLEEYIEKSTSLPDSYYTDDKWKKREQIIYLSVLLGWSLSKPCDTMIKKEMTHMASHFSAIINIVDDLHSINDCCTTKQYSTVKKDNFILNKGLYNAYDSFVHHKTECISSCLKLGIYTGTLEIMINNISDSATKMINHADF